MIIFMSFLIGLNALYAGESPLYVCPKTYKLSRLIPIEEIEKDGRLIEKKRVAREKRSAEAWLRNDLNEVIRDDDQNLSQGFVRLGDNPKIEFEKINNGARPFIESRIQSNHFVLSKKNSKRCYEVTNFAIEIRDRKLSNNLISHQVDLSQIKIADDIQTSMISPITKNLINSKLVSSSTKDLVVEVQLAWRNILRNEGRLILNRKDAEILLDWPVNFKDWVSNRCSQLLLALDGW